MTTTPRTWSSGEVPTGATFNTEVRDQFNSIFDAWPTYTPIWTATVDPAIGNGVLTGRYLKVGRRVDLSVLLTCGSTTTYGSGAWNFSLPFPAASASVAYLGSARMSAADTWHGQVSINNGASTFQITFPQSATNTRSANASQGTPATLAATHAIRASVTYQSAT